MLRSQRATLPPGRRHSLTHGQTCTYRHTRMSTPSQWTASGASSSSSPHKGSYQLTQHTGCVETGGSVLPWLTCELTVQFPDFSPEVLKTSLRKNVFSVQVRWFQHPSSRLITKGLISNFTERKNHLGICSNADLYSYGLGFIPPQPFFHLFISLWYILRNVGSEYFSAIVKYKGSSWIQDRLCDFCQITYPFFALVSESIKWGYINMVLVRIKWHNLC